MLSELTHLIDAHFPQLLAQPRCGPVTAAIIIGHTAGAKRFLTDGHFARHAGTAPIPASSGKIQRRLPRASGRRQDILRPDPDRASSPLQPCGA